VPPNIRSTLVVSRRSLTLISPYFGQARFVYP
jgi:hypothetical protein